MRRLLCMVLLMVVGMRAAAQVAVNNFTVNEGLPSNNVYGLLADQDGYLWAGTDNGIARFDGKRFKVLTSADGIADNEVFGFFQDSHERIWLRSFSGKPCYLHRGRVFNAENDSSLAAMQMDSYILSIEEYKDTVFFASAIGQIVRYHGGRQGRTTRLHSKAWPNFALTDRGLYAVNLLELMNVHTNAVVAQHVIKRQFTNRGTTVGGDFYVSADHDLRKMELSDQPTSTVTWSFNSPILFLGKCTDKAIYVGTETGGYRLHLDSLRLDTLIKGFPVSAISQDFEGGLWLATLNHGLFYFGSSQSYLMGQSRPDKPHSEYLFGTTPDNRWFCLGENGDYTSIDGPQVQSISKHSVKNLSGKIYSYLWFADDTLFISGERMGCILVPSTGTYVRSDVFQRWKSMQLLERDTVLASTGEAYYVSNFQRFKKSVFLFEQDCFSAFLRVNCIVKAGDRVIMGSNDGVYELKHLRVERVAPQSTLLHDRVKALTLGEDGNIWVGLANQGIASLKGETATILNDHFRLPNVNKIRIGPNGTLWACSHEGVFKFYKQADGTYARESFTPSLGYPLANTWDVLPLPGMVYAATSHGLIRFASTANATPPRLVIEGASYGGRKLDIDAPDRDSGHRPGKGFKVKFTGISFRNRGELTYHYRIPEMEETWHTTALGEIEYPVMGYGDFTFELKAVGTTGLESPVQRIAWVVSPYFWQTWWFISLYVVAGLGLVWLFYRWRVRRLQAAHASAQEQSRVELEKLASELYVKELEQKAMRLQMNPHFIFNALNTIQGLYASKDIPKAKAYISRLSTLIRQILEQSAYATISLETELELLRAYLDVTLYRFENLFTYEVTVDEGIVLETVQVPPLILQPIVENAVIHGIAPKGGNGRISIAVQKQGGRIQIRIRDNGVGFRQSQLHKTSIPGKSQSKGMNLTKDRLRQLWQDGDGALQIEEVLDAHQQVAGTEVTILIGKPENT